MHGFTLHVVVVIDLLINLLSCF